MKVLAIGDIGNIVRTIQKYSKSEIHLINYPKEGSGNFIYPENVELFESWKVSDNVKKINQIKDEYDICLATGSQRIAYLADLNYIAYFLGRDIDVPLFKKNSSEEWQEEALFKKNVFERKFYWDVFKNSIAYVAGMWQYESLAKYTSMGINSARIPIDEDEFNKNIKPIELKKTKFTFFSPNRLEKAKGTDLLWKALKLCKTDFEVLMVDWFGETTKEEIEFKEKLLENIPSQIKFISPIKRSEIGRYYKFADAVFGNLFIGTFELVGLESVMCGTPVIQYTDKKRKIIIDGQEIESPFLPLKNDPESIAETIDKIVKSPEFRHELYVKEYDFVRTVSDPRKCAEWWDNLFEELVKKHKTIRKNSSCIRIRIRMWNFLLANRLYWFKIKKVLTGKNYETNQTLYHK